MKLRNRRTGVIRDTEKWVFSVSDKGILFGDTAYNSLAELCKEWEDYEEPKEYWYIDEWGNIQDTDYYNDQYDNAAKEIGNKFETKEEAEKAVEKLKALTRLEDNGFKFEGWTIDDGLRVSIRTNIDGESIYDDSKKELRRILDLLFSGGEE